MADGLFLAAVTLSLSDYAVIGGMLATTGTIITLLMLGTTKAVTRRVETVEDRVRDVENKKVNKDDWLRETLSTRQKVDHVSEQLHGIKSKLDSEIGMAVALNRLAEGLKLMAEKRSG